MKLARKLLYPISVLYGIFMLIRNKLFDWKILPSREYEIPIISIGNLSVGGTGKTPHTEYVIRLVSPSNKVAVLSRGYGRKTSGFILAKKESDAKEIGDEPRQVKNKFTDVSVAVDEKRTRGINKLLELEPKLNAIVLDDAFQHRSVVAGISILLTDYSLPFYKEHVLPYGNLREFSSGYKRADVIIVTKTPENLNPIERKKIIKELKADSYQKVYFSHIRYGKLISLFKNTDNNSNEEVAIEDFDTAFLITGIANPASIKEYLNKKIKKVVELCFSDHHEYSLGELVAVKEKFEQLQDSKKIIITTEKDAMRLKNPGSSDIVKNLPIFYLPIEVDFFDTDKENFDNQILNFISRDSIRTKR